MQYYSTRDRELKTTLKEGVQKGLAPDGGLWMPERYPVLTASEMEQLRHSGSLAESGRIIARKLFGEELSEGELDGMVEDALDFDTPLVEIEKGIHVLELFHGPTLAFKDVGARFMARMVGHFNQENQRMLHVLVATSGDTGSAVANGFLGVEGLHVHVLYPSGKVSPLQEKQFTTLGKNITALEVNGTFDDCQAMVKAAFSDRELNKQVALTSANSINLARMLPQSFYYFRGWAQAIQMLNGNSSSGNHKGGLSKEVIFAVPSGNYGNLTAGLIGREMGLPAHTFLAASNANDVIPRYLDGGNYEPGTTIPTIANAMDVSAPSNFERIQALFGNRHERINTHLKGFSNSDQEIRETIHQVLEETGYLMDPHTATAYRAAKIWRSNPDPSAAGDLPILLLATAHPAKFLEVVEPVIGRKVEIPERLAACQEREKKSLPMEKGYERFKTYLAAL